MNLIGTKKLTTKRLLLKPQTMNEQKRLWEILCNSEVNKYYLTSKFGFNWSEQEKYYKKKISKANNNDVFIWSVFLKDNNICIGQVSVQENSDSSNVAIRDIGYYIDPIYQGKGYGYEAVKEILDYMFNKVNILEIQTSVAPQNIASWKLLEKIGFKKNGKNIKVKYTYVLKPIKNNCYVITKDDINK